MTDWQEINAWRKDKRAELLAARVAPPQAEREALAARVVERLRPLLPAPAGLCVGFYWPFKGEIDLRPLLRDLVAAGAEAALPVVVEKNRPLEFWRWTPGAKMGRGIWNIPVPAERDPVDPNLLLVPLVGFDACGYRLGYGGGYYDRTLAARDPRPRTIGIGFEAGRLASIGPQRHDIPLDAIVTEAETRRFADGAPLEEAARFASPPCFLHELDPDYLGLSSDGAAPRSAPKGGTEGR